MTKKKVKKNQIKNDWQKLSELKEKLDINIKAAQVDYETIPEALILAQKFNNQIDFVDKEYGIPNDEISEQKFSELKKDLRPQHHPLYRAF